MMEEVVRQADSPNAHNFWPLICPRLSMTVGYDSNGIVSLLKRQWKTAGPDE